MYEGIFDNCGKINPFEYWNSYNYEKKAAPDLEVFMNHYDIKPFHGPPKAASVVNSFFQTKYGMFTCYGLKKDLGKIPYDPTLLTTWERDER